ncbi:MAG: helix-turn-helix transcriptional regulator [Firmicutes bacterium]|nr:helix-turn-helix transcriptional regulator [Bacillota bacterium]
MATACSTAQRIRNIRIQNGMTQTQLASRCNVTKSLICKIEANKASINLELLLDIAQSLGVNISDLVSSSAPKKMATIVRSNDRRKWASSNTPGKLGYEYFRVGGSREAKMEAFVLLIQEGAKSARYVEHDGLEFFLVLEGDVKLNFREEEYVLKNGDTAFFDANHGHKILPHNCDRAEILLLYVRN